MASLPFHCGPQHTRLHQFNYPPRAQLPDKVPLMEPVSVRSCLLNSGPSSNLMLHEGRWPPCSRSVVFISPFFVPTSEMNAFLRSIVENFRYNLACVCSCVQVYFYVSSDHFQIIISFLIWYHINVLFALIRLSCVIRGVM